MPIMKETLRAIFENGVFRPPKRPTSNPEQSAVPRPINVIINWAAGLK
jgi:hypothetical protein